VDIIIIGTGKVAYILAGNFIEAGHHVVQVSGRNKEKADKLAQHLNTDSAPIEKINTHAKIYLLAVSDDAIHEVSDSLPAVDGIIIHCSGNTPLDAISTKHQNTGVLYPLDSFSRNTLTSMNNTPLLIEGSNKSSLDTINKLAHSISNNVSELNSVNRAQVHISAVLTNNFITFLSSKAKSRLQNKNIDPDILNKLLETTLHNILQKEPSVYQTGPAFRNDLNTIEQHIKLLNDDPGLAELYKIISKELISSKK
jgi:predicted short-subunit dehydrogenase-like oxidoreductase (DUF2520 family)